jgi:hypothetical protein
MLRRRRRRRQGKRMQLLRGEAMVGLAPPPSLCAGGPRWRVP